MSRPTLGSWLRPRTGEAELAEIYGRIEARRDRVGRPRVVVVALALGLAVGLALVWGGRRPGETSLAAHDRVFAPPPDTVVPVLVALDDGSHLVVLPGARLELDGPDRVRLVRGRVAFAITHPRPTPFVVDAGATSVVVLGTRFAVERRVDDMVEVAVDEGRVQVLQDGAEVAQQTARQVRTWPPTAMWAGTSGGADDATSAETARREGSAGSDDPARVVDRGASRNAVAAARVDRAVVGGGRGASRRGPGSAGAPPDSARESSSEAPDDAGGSAVGEAAVPVGTSTDAVAVGFAAADLARQDGRPAEAARILQRLLVDYRADSRAGMVAFALARVRLESLQQPAEAAVALEDALRLGVPAALAESVRARLVEAYVAVGDTTRARDVARDYLKYHPRGRRVEEIRRWAR